MINVIASIKVREGGKSEFIEIFKSNIPNVLEEKGCIEYILTADCCIGKSIICGWTLTSWIPQTTGLLPLPTLVALRPG